MQLPLKANFGYRFPLPVLRFPPGLPAAYMPALIRLLYSRAALLSAAFSFMGPGVEETASDATLRTGDSTSGPDQRRGSGGYSDHPPL